MSKSTSKSKSTSTSKFIFKAIGVSAVAATVFASGAFAQADTAYVPFVVNVDARVFAKAGNDSVSMDAAANTADTLKIPLKQTSIRYASGAQGRLNAPTVTVSRGNIALRLPAQSYNKAEIALYSVNGRRVLRGRLAGVSEIAVNISRRNVAAGVYMLSVKGIGANTFTARLTHGGGDANISAAFSAEPVYPAERQSVSPEKQLRKQAAEGEWEITVSTRWSVRGKKDTAYALTPVAGRDNPVQDITFQYEPCPPSMDVFTDRRDGACYRRVTIGEQTWMAQNLDYDVPNVTSDVCYNNRPDSCAKYGRLYDWNTAMGGAAGSSAVPSGVQGVCPTGWHLPSDAEWDTLVNYAGGAAAGTQLKSPNYWNSYSGIPKGADAYGFSALPGGDGYANGSFNYAGSYGGWWSATKDGGGVALHRNMNHDSESVGGSNRYSDGVFSVRCVMDVR